LGRHRRRERRAPAVAGRCWTGDLLWTGFLGRQPFGSIPSGARVMPHGVPVVFPGNSGAGRNGHGAFCHARAERLQKCHMVVPHFSGVASRVMPEMMRAHAGSRDGAEHRLALLDELRQSERRAAISRVASVIGHLIGTPLNVIAGRAALIRANPSADSAAENARRIEEQVERLALRIRRLIDYLTGPEPKAEPRAADAVVADALSLYAPIAQERGVSISVHPEEPPSATVEGTSALVVLTSLLSLALRIAPRGTCVELDVQAAASGGVVFDLLVPGL